MILSQPELREAVAKGEIRFDPPLEERQWHEASVDLRLGLKFTKLTAKKGLKFSLAHGFPALAGTDLWIEKTLHSSEQLLDHVEFLNGWAAHDGAPHIEILPLPAQAQFLNVIESVFSGMARAVIHNSDYGTVADARPQSRATCRIETAHSPLPLGGPDVLSGDRRESRPRSP